MKKQLITLALVAGTGAGMVSLLLLSSCTTKSPSSPTFGTPVAVVSGLNPTLTFTQTYTATFYFTPTQTFTPSLTSTPYVTATWPGVVLTFTHPSGVAVYNCATCTPAGPFVFVADTGNNRVEKYNSAGALVAGWGNFGKGKGAVSMVSPIAVAVDNTSGSNAGYLYVVSNNGSGAASVIAYDSKGDYQKQFTSFVNPRGVAVDNSGNIYVSDAGTTQVSAFTYSGASANFGTITLTPGFQQAGVTINNAVTLSGIAWDGAVGGLSTLFVATQGTGVNGSAYDSVFTIGNSAVTSVITGFNGPNALAFDGSGNLYVADATTSGTNGTIEEFAAGVLTTPGSPPSDAFLGNGILVDPKGVAVDANGNIYVADYTAGNNGDGSVIFLGP